MSKNASKNIQVVSGQHRPNDLTSSQPPKRRSKDNVTIRADGGTRNSNNYRDTQHLIKLEKSTQHIYKVALENRLYLAPLARLERVLDVGSGYGFWAVDMAKSNPATEVSAFDLLPASSGPHPKNATFRTQDCCESWPYPKDYFDLIHIRGLFGSIQDWPTLYQRALKHLRPGGFIEHLEWSLHIRSADGKLSSNSMFSQWSQNIVSAGAISGKTYEIAENMAGLVDEAGFENVVEQGQWWPIGAWSGDAKMQDIGRMNLVNWVRALEAQSFYPFEDKSNVSRTRLAYV